MFLDVVSGLVTWLFKLRVVPWWLWAAALALSASPLAVIAAWVVWGGTNHSERVADVTGLAAFVTLVDAAIAGGVAVAAYFQATRTPDLQLWAGFPDKGRYRLRSSTEEDLTGRSPWVLVFPRRAEPQTMVLVLQLENLNKYSARNPAVKLIVHSGQHVVGWGTGSGEWTSAPDRYSAQWDGIQVHGTWTRILPFLELGDLGPASDDPYTIECEVVAEGFRKDFVIWIRHQAT
jgi:hypothetical protein